MRRDPSQGRCLPALHGAVLAEAVWAPRDTRDGESGTVELVDRVSRAMLVEVERMARCRAMIGRELATMRHGGAHWHEVAEQTGLDHALLQRFVGQYRAQPLWAATPSMQS